jgi:iron complex outermembrane receptor protein
MAESASALKEVVVIGYGTIEKKGVTGSVATVNEKDFQKGNITTPEQLIVGKVAGVNITSNSGAPGSGGTIRIRGGASLSASNSPLIVIDGVPLSNNSISGASNPLSLINPNDIATMTVLKDASATAIYGSRASNGVILITTKQGTSGKPKLSFNSQVSINKVGRTPDVLTADEFRTYVNANGTPAQIALLGKANTNWSDEIYRTAVGNDNNLTVSGAYKNLPYRLSAGYLGQKGVLLTDNLERKSGALSLNPEFFNNTLKVDLNLKGSISNTRFANQGAIGAAAAFDPTQPVEASNNFGNFFEWSTTVDGVTTLNPNASRNPYALLALRDDRSEVKRSFGNLQLDYQLPVLKGLRANLNLGYDISNSEGNTFVPAEAASSFAVGGLDNDYQQKVNNKVAEFYLNFSRDLARLKSNLNLTAGYGYYDFLNTNYNFPRYKANGEMVAGSEPQFAFDKPQYTLLSYYGRAIYTFHDKYTLSASLRTDGSSRFSPENRWGVFPSVAFNWMLIEENFLKTSRSLSDLKLRLSYGITGQQDGIPYYSYLPVYNNSQTMAKYQFGNDFYTMYAPTAYDRNIKWEQTATYNAGVDYGFLDNRLTGSVDVYLKRTKDLLNTIPSALGANFTNQITTNVGNLENKGIEFAINGSPVKTDELSWDLGFNVTYNQNKITNLTAVEDPSYAGAATGNISGGIGQTIQINSVGYNTNSFYVYKQVYDGNGKPMEGIYADLNGDNIINQKDLYRYQSSAPKVFLGFSTQASYKKFSLSTVLRSNLGNYVYHNVGANLGVRNQVLNPVGFLGNATQEIYASGFTNNQYLTDYHLQNASFLRMDNLSLSYNFGSLTKGNRAPNLGLSATCQNVFVVTKYKGVDPEIFSGIDNNFYPRPRTLVLGANLNF